MRLSWDTPSRLARALFIVMMALAWCGAPQTARGQEAPADDATAADAAKLRSLADEVERLCRAGEAAGKRIPRTTFDPAAVVEAVGREPAALCAWVRANTAWVPYRGALRGPVGVLMDRLGNSLDRSLLLAELMRTAGHTVRLAHAELSEQQGAEVLDRVRNAAPDPALADAAAPAVPADGNRHRAVLEQLAGDFGLDAKAVLDASSRADARAAQLAERASSRSATQSAELFKLVGATERPAAAQGDAPDLAAIRDHWWVQRRAGGKWTHFDLLAPDGDPAAPAAAAQVKHTVNYEPKQGKVPLRAEWCHEVDLRVIVERTTGGKATEQAVLSQTLRPADLGGRSVTVSHLPLNRPLTPESLAELRTPGQLAAEVLRHDEWLPLIILGDGPALAQSSFDEAGQVDRSPDVNALGGAKKVKKATGLFDTLPGGDGDRKPARGAAGRLTAEWIEYEIRSPGLPPRKIRRDVFDLIGAAARANPDFGAGAGAADELTDAQKLARGLALLGQVEVLIVGNDLSPEYVAGLEARSMAANAVALPPLLRSAAGGEGPGATASQLEQLRPPPGPLYALSLARVAWSPARADVFVDRPNLFTYRSSLRPELAPQGNVADANLVSVHGIDIVANEVAVRRGTPDPFAARISQGVTDTNAEAFVMAAGLSGGGHHDGAGGHGAAPAHAPLLNTAEAFAARGEGAAAPWVVVRRADDPQLRQLALPAPMLAGIERDLRAGYAAVIPPTPPATRDGGFVWWRVDPATGQTLGVDERGLGTSMTEEILLTVRVALRSGAALLCIYGMQRSSWSAGARTAGMAACVLALYVSSFGVAGRSVLGWSAETAQVVGALGDMLTLAIGTIRALNP